jgi:hypothetical protein
MRTRRRADKRSTDRMHDASCVAGASFDPCDAAPSPLPLLRAVTPPLSAFGCQSRTPTTGMSLPRQCRAPIRQQATRLRANGRGLFPLQREISEDVRHRIDALEESCPLQSEISEAARHNWIDAFEESCEAEPALPDVLLEDRFWALQAPPGPSFPTFTAVVPAQQDAVSGAGSASGAPSPRLPRFSISEKEPASSASDDELAACSQGMPTVASAPSAKRLREPVCSRDARTPRLRRQRTPTPPEQPAGPRAFPRGAALQRLRLPRRTASSSSHGLLVRLPPPSIVIRTSSSPERSFVLRMTPDPLQHDLQAFFSMAPGQSSG